MRELAIHQITMMQGGPKGLIEFAARAGLTHVCLFTATPLRKDGTDMFPIIYGKQIAEFQILLRDHGVSITNAEYFPIMPVSDASIFTPAIERAAMLGAKRIVTHIHDPETDRAAQSLIQLCELAIKFGLEVGLEFTGFSRGCDSLELAVEIHGKVEQKNLGIAIDALHLFRTGGTLEQLKAVDPTIISYAQICDGATMDQTKDYVSEAMSRLIPGQGCFPLQEFVRLLGQHVDLDIEVPQSPQTTDLSPHQWATVAIEECQKLLE